MRQKFKNDFIELKKHKQKFSISLDEWTSVSNKRYINIIIHSSEKFFNTGLVRIKDSLTAEKCVTILDERLNEFSLSLSNDIVAVITDGASTMVKVGKLISTHQQLCLAHGIQLAVIDVMYKKKDKFEHIIANDEDDEIDFEDGTTLDFLQECPDAEYSEITDNLNLGQIIDKVRNIVRSFRKSPKKNEILQNYVKMDCGKELALILDCKTRWNSMLNMLERFLLLEAPIRKAAIDVKTLCLAENELELIKNVIKVLKPAELAVKTLCRREINLCTADAAIVFMLNEIDNIISPVAFKMFDAIKTRVLERRTIYTSILNFLKKGYIQRSIIEDHVSIQMLEKEIVVILKKIEIESEEETENSFDSDVIEEQDVSLEDKMEKVLAASTKAKNCSSRITLSEAVAQEISLFVNGGKLGKYLQLTHDCILTIPPTSVECERCFSTSGQVCNKIRSSLSDSTLDELVFLKNYLKNN